MTEFAPRLADEGLKLCYHHHMGTIIQSERDIDALMAHTKPPVHLLLDTGHAWAGPIRRGSRAPIGNGSATCIARTCAKRRCANRTPATGASSMDPRNGEGTRRLYRPGRRHDRLATVVQGLKGYSGWVVLEAEQDPKKAPALPYAKKGVAHMRAARRSRGSHRGVGEGEGRRHAAMNCSFHPPTR